MPRDNMMQQEAVQTNNVQFMDVTEQHSPLNNMGGWLDLSYSRENYVNTNVPFAYTMPTFNKEERKALKNYVSNSSNIRKEFNDKKLSEIAVWGIGSVEIEGASPQFKNLAVTLYRFNQLYNEMVAAKDDELKTELKEKIDELAETLMVNANEYIALHGKSKQRTDKGKNRMALARYITSSKFLGRFLVEGQQEISKNSFEPLSNYYTGDSFLFERRFKKSMSKYYAYNDLPENQEIYKKFIEKYSKSNMDERRQFASIFSSDKAYNNRVVEAMKDAVKEPADMKAIYAILDEKVNEILNFTITPAMFEKDYALQNADEVARLNNLSIFSADFFQAGNIYSKLGLPYLDRIKKIHKQAFEVINKKLDLISTAGGQISVNAGINYCVRPNVLLKYAKDKKANDFRCRDYSKQSTEERADDFTRFVDYNVFVERMKNVGIDKTIYNTGYNFDRKKNRERLGAVINANKQKVVEDFKKRSKTNPRVNEGSHTFMDFSLDNSATKLIDFYIPQGSRYRAMLGDILYRDMQGNAYDVDGTLSGMLKMVRFDEHGVPLDEYQANHEWNIKWIDGYKKAASHPDKVNAEYEQCLSDLIEFATDEKNISDLEKICEDLSFERDEKKMEFFHRMTKVALRLVDNHLSRSIAAKKYWDKIDDRKKELIRAKLNYITAVSDIAIFKIRERYQCDIGVNKFEALYFHEEGEQYQPLKLLCTTGYDEAKKKLESLR